MTRIAFFAAEPSADRLGAEVARELLKKMPKAELVGVGGEALESLGLKSIFDIRDFATIGASELIANLPLLVRHLRQTIKALRNLQPDIFISVDMSLASYIVAQGLSKKISKGASNPQRKLPIKIHYIAPSVWLSRAWRARSFVRCYDLILTLYPFEPRYFQLAASKIKSKIKNKISAAPARAVHVGHPIFDDLSPRGNGASFRKKHLYAKNEQIVGLFFGSRAKEVRRFAPLLLEAARQLREQRKKNRQPEPRFIATSFANLLPLLKPMLRENDPPVQLILAPEEKDDAICACNAALAACGTVGAELAIRHVPHALFYSVSSITYLLAKLLYNLRYFGLVNLLADKLVVKEFIQSQARAKLLAAQANKLLGAEGAALAKVLAAMFPRGKSKAQDDARGKSSLRVAEKTSLRVAEKPSLRAAEKPSLRAAEKPSLRAAEKPSLRAAEEIFATYKALSKKSR